MVCYKRAAHKVWVVSQFLLAKFEHIWYDFFVEINKSAVHRFRKRRCFAQNHGSFRMDCNPRFIVQILFLTPPLEGPVGHLQFPCRRPAADLTPAPRSHDRFVVLTPVLALPPEVDAPGLCRRNTFGLPLAVELPLRLSHVAQKLKHNVGNQHPSKVPPLAGIQQRHVQHYDGHLLVLG